jgi:hypothetical protein
MVLNSSLSREGQLKLTNNQTDSKLRVLATDYTLHKYIFRVLILLEGQVSLRILSAASATDQLSIGVSPLRHHSYGVQSSHSSYNYLFVHVSPSTAIRINEKAIAESFAVVHRTLSAAKPRNGITKLLTALVLGSVLGSIWSCKQ